MTGTDDSISIREHLETSLKSQREFLEASLRNQREYIDLAVKRVSDGVVSLEARMGDASSQHNLSHAREHTLVADAVDKAEKAMTAQLAAVKSEFEQYKSNQKEELERIRASVDRQSNQWSRLLGAGAAFGALVTVLAIVAYVIK